MTKKIKLVPSLQTHWFELCKLRAEGCKLGAEGRKLYDEADKRSAEAEKLYVEARKRRDEASKLYAKGDTNFLAAVITASGPNTQVHWTDKGCIVGEGPNAKTYLFAEPL